MTLFVTPRQLRRTSEFYRELAALLGAGVPVVQSLHTILRLAPSGRSKSALMHVASRIEAGSSLTEAFSAEVDWLPAFDLALIQAGETSGRIVETCRSLAEHYSARARLAEIFIGRLLYPAFLLHLAVLVFPTGQLVGLVWRGEVGAFLQQKAVVLGPLYLALLGITVALQSRRSASWRAVVESLLRAVPLLGAARHELALARLAGALEALISAGLGIIEAWQLAAAASHSATITQTVQSWLARLHSGELPSEMVRASGAFTELFANLYFTGETSGKLDQELHHLSEYYLESGGRKLNGFMMGLAVAVSLGIMAAIAVFVLRFWIGYFNQLSNAIGN